MSRSAPGCLVATLVLGVMLGAATICAEDAALAYGRHLAGECTACHRPAAGAGAIPAIAGRPAAELLALLSDYRDGRKTNPVMVSVAKSLDDRQMKALAAYFASLPKSASTAAPPR